MTKCPDGHRWWECKHPTTYTQRVIGACMMAVGVATIAIALGELVRG